MAKRLVPSGRTLLRTLLPQSVRAKAQPFALRVAARRVLGAAAFGEPRDRAGPLVVSGLLSEAKGISEAARLTILALDKASYHPIGHELRDLLNGQGALPAAERGGAWIIHANAPEAILAMARVDPSQWLGRYRIGYWAFELPAVPAYWVKAAKAFHEIWAPSRFVADALKSSGVDTPVRVMPHPVALRPAAPEADRARFGIPRESFAVLAMGDLRSSPMRKNLIGAIEIYCRAFPSPQAGGHLVIKVQSADVHPHFKVEFANAVRDRSDIRLATESLSNDDVRQLIKSCDVLLSPHRSEGFGLTLAEALVAGVPALATGWSGNLDFMSGIPELLIGHKLVPVHDPYGVYRSGRLLWAEPDNEDAAEKLLALANSPALRQALAAKGREAVEGLSAAWHGEALAKTRLFDLRESGS